MPAKTPPEKEFEVLPEGLREPVRNLFHEDYMVRRVSARQLMGKRHLEAISHFHRVLEGDEDEIVRGFMVEALENLNQPESIPHLAKAALFDDFELVRINSKNVLEFFDPEQVLRSFLPFLKGEDRDVKGNASVLLDHFGEALSRKRPNAPISVFLRRNKAVRGPATFYRLFKKHFP